MKKLILFVICILITNVVMAQTVRFHFYADEATGYSDNIYLDGNLICLKDGSYYMLYDSKATINNINSINGEIFTLNKDGKALTSGAEWYSFDKSGNKHYYAQNKSYLAGDIVKELKLGNSDLVIIDLYANWSEAEDVKVEEPENPNFQLKITDYKLKAGETTNLHLVESTDSLLIWTSSNKNVATVDSKGKVKAKSVGKATITVKDAEGNKATCNIEVVKDSTHAVKIVYDMNGGKLNDYHSKYVSKTFGFSDELKCNDDKYCQKILYQSTTSDSGLLNFNNYSYINIYKKGHRIKSGNEVWNTKKDGTGKSYSQYKVYKASDFCNAKSKDCTVTLYANWVKDTKEYKIALIGNSKTRFGNEKYPNSRVSVAFEKLAKEAGFKAKTTVIVKGGSTLEDKAEKEPYKTDIKSGTYDYVVIQERTPRVVSDLNEYKAGALKVVDLLKNKKANIYVRSSWPDKSDGKDKFYQEHTNNMINNTQEVVDYLKTFNYKASFINDAKAFKAASDSGIKMYISDNNHPTTEGAYLAAVCIYKHIFRVRATTINYYYGLDSNVARKLLYIAEKNC